MNWLGRLATSHGRHSGLFTHIRYRQRDYRWLRYIRTGHQLIWLGLLACRADFRWWVICAGRTRNKAWRVLFEDVKSGLLDSTAIAKLEEILAEWFGSSHHTALPWPQLQPWISAWSIWSIQDDIVCEESCRGVQSPMQTCFICCAFTKWFQFPRSWVTVCKLWIFIHWRSLYPAQKVLVWLKSISFRLSTPNANSNHLVSTSYLCWYCAILHVLKYILGENENWCRSIIHYRHASETGALRLLQSNRGAQIFDGRAPFRIFKISTKT